jgi:hypothetical protein
VFEGCLPRFATVENLAYRPLPIDQSNVRYEHGPDSERRLGIATGETVELPTRRLLASQFNPDYDFRLVLGDGGHSPNHGVVLLPDALRWAFRPAGDEQPAT